MLENAWKLPETESVLYGSNK